jgi:hypothetical protein
MSEVKTQITYEQLVSVIEAKNLTRITDNIFCPGCENPKMIDYENTIYVTDLFDVILEGKCDKCRKEVNRYIETGENEENVKKVKIILSQN